MEDPDEKGSVVEETGADDGDLNASQNLEDDVNHGEEEEEEDPKPDAPSALQPWDPALSHTTISLAPPLAGDIDIGAPLSILPTTADILQYRTTPSGKEDIIHLTKIRWDRDQQSGLFVEPSPNGNFGK